MVSDIEIYHVPPQRIASIRATCRRDEIAATLAQLYGEIGLHLTAHGVEASGPPIARYHVLDCDTLEIEGGLPICQPLTAAGRIGSNMIPAARAVIAIHAGHYDSLQAAYRIIEDWMRHHHVESTCGP